MRKTVLIFGHNYATQFIDVYNQYSRLFDQNHYEITVVYLTGKPDKKVKDRTLADHVIFLDMSKKVTRGLKISAIQKMLSLCKEKKFSIVICHRYKPTYIMLWVSQLVRIPAMIFVMHELRTLSSIMRRMLIAALAQKNALFAGVSNAVRDDIRKDIWHVPEERVVTLYNCQDIELTEPLLFSREEARAQLGLTSDDFVFGNIGRLARNKDQKSLIEAFAKIKPAHPKAKLIILGSGDLETNLKQQVQQLGLTNDIIFSGFVNDAFRFMKAFDVFVLSSIQEAFGRVLIEAMMAKTPIIATSVNGIPEVVGNAGILVTANNPQELTEAMQTTLNWSAEAHQQAGETAYQRVHSQFSIPAFQQTFWQLPLLQAAKDSLCE